MREIRTFELEHGEPAAAWRVAQPLVLKVMAGEVWLTVSGDLTDHWLASGESFELPRGAQAWISAGRTGARVALAVEEGRVGTPRPAAAGLRAPVRSWLPRWLLAA